MECPRCAAVMADATFDAHLGRAVVIDICHACQSFWFDARESVALTPASTLALFRLIGERLERPAARDGDVAHCPRCRARLRRTRDMQRATRFEYLACPHGHGRLITFFDFLREKDFIRPLTPHQIAELQQSVGSVRCASCGAAVDLAAGAACAHCGTPLSVLDLQQAGRLVAHLQQAGQRAGQPVDPALPLALARARRETEQAFAGLPGDGIRLDDLAGGDLVAAGLSAVARWFRGSS